MTGRCLPAIALLAAVLASLGFVRPADVLADEPTLEPAITSGHNAVERRLGTLDGLLRQISGVSSTDAVPVAQVVVPRSIVRWRTSRMVSRWRAACGNVLREAQRASKSVEAIAPATPDGTAGRTHAIASFRHATGAAVATCSALEAVRANQWSRAGAFARRADRQRGRWLRRSRFAERRMFMSRGGQLRSWQYRTTGYQPQVLAPEDRPSALGRPIPLSPEGQTLDADGAVVQLIDGRRQEHPLAYARFAIRLLESYRLNRSSAYLRRARVNLERMVNRTGVFARGAEYFRYPFDFQLAPDPSSVIRAPWYSGIAQGRALSAFLRMYEATGEPIWRERADRTFRSFVNDRQRRQPWVSYVDADGNLWLEQYPTDTPSHVLNGHITAAIGLYEYALATGDPQARELFDAAATTVRRNFRRYRVPGQLSRYDLLYRRTFKNYHEAHIRQLRQLALMTGDATFKQYADLLERDQRTAGPETG
jgi:hypothetical protein